MGGFSRGWWPRLRSEQPTPRTGASGWHKEPTQARLFAGAARLREETGLVRRWHEGADREERVAALRERLGEGGFSAEWAEGWAMGLDAVIPDAVGY
jgi:hypothetical protein